MVTNWSAHIFVKAWRLLMKLYGGPHLFKDGVAFELALICRDFKTHLPLEV